MSFKYHAGSILVCVLTDVYVSVLLITSCSQPSSIIEGTFCFIPESQDFPVLELDLRMKYIFIGVLLSIHPYFSSSFFKQRCRFCYSIAADIVQARNNETGLTLTVDDILHLASFSAMASCKYIWFRRSLSSVRHLWASSCSRFLLKRSAHSSCSSN